MAPEQQAAVAAVEQGASVPQAVDGRADVYSLGLLLQELLGGEPAAVPGLRRRNVQVTTGLADMLARCLAPDPRDRYADAAALAADLRRYLADLPLRGVRNRSWAERWRKWRRRRPLAPAMLGFLIAFGVVAGMVLAYFGRQLDKARLALREGHDQFAGQHYGRAKEAWRRGLALAEDVPFARGLAMDLRNRLRLVDQAQAALELHVIAERVRTLTGSDHYSPGAWKLMDSCRTIWERRDIITDRLGSFPEAGLREQIQADLLDIAVLGAQLRVQLAPPGQAGTEHSEALLVLDQAELLFGPNLVIYSERQRHARALGLAEMSEAAARQGSVLAPRNAWEHLTLGRARYQAGEHAEAAVHFDRALALEPRSFWATFYKAKCAFRRRDHQEALLGFTACLALAPEQAWCWHNRGLVLGAIGKLDRALADFDRALELDDALGSAALARAWLHLRAGRYSKALADLDRAEKHGASPTVVHFSRALVFVAQGNGQAAAKSVRKALGPTGPDRLP
jgi:tetratricopeptide (TPR) repeat protein